MRNDRSLTAEKAWREIRSQGWLSAIDIDVPGYEWYIVEQLLDSTLQHVSVYLFIYLTNSNMSNISIHNRQGIMAIGGQHRAEICC